MVHWFPTNCTSSSTSYHQPSINDVILAPDICLSNKATYNDKNAYNNMQFNMTNQKATSQKDLNLENLQLRWRNRKGFNS